MNAAFQAFLTAIKADAESDLATIASPPVISLLTNLAAHKGNKIMQGADIVQFVASGPAAGLALEAEAEGQFLELGIALIQGTVAQAPAAPSAAAAAAGMSAAAAAKVTAKPA